MPAVGGEGADSGDAVRRRPLHRVTQRLTPRWRQVRLSLTRKGRVSIPYAATREPSTGRRLEDFR